MNAITLPVWQLIGAVALPSLILFILVVRLVSQKRRRKKRLAAMDRPVQTTTVAYDSRIHQEMVSQQIDAVFNALNAVIEAERVKLKALLLHRWEEQGPVEPIRQTADQLLEESTDEALKDLTRQYRLDREDGRTCPDSAAEGQLSRNEAALAVMLRRKSGQKRPRLETVA